MGIHFSIEPMVLISYPSARDFTIVLKTISEIVDEVAIQISTSGVHVKALDPSRIAMLVVDLPPEAFQEFSVNEDMSIGLAVSNLVKIFKSLKKSDRLVIAANNEYIEILVEGTTGGRRYRFRNISILAEEMPKLNLVYDVEASILASPLKTLLKDLTDVVDTVGIEANNDVITFFDYDSKKYSFKLTSASGNILNLVIKKNMAVAYDSEYISKIIDLLSLSNIVDLRYGIEVPLSLSIEFSGGKATYYLASKV